MVIMIYTFFRCDLAQLFKLNISMVTCIWLTSHFTSSGSKPQKHLEWTKLEATYGRWARHRIVSHLLNTNLYCVYRIAETITNTCTHTHLYEEVVTIARHLKCRYSVLLVWRDSLHVVLSFFVLFLLLLLL